MGFAKSLVRMAGRTQPWRGLVQQHFPPLHHLNVCMASGTAHTFVAALQGEGGLPVVVEQRRLPLGCVVAFRARGPLSFDGKLAAMDVRVAILAAARCGIEANVAH